MTELTDKERYKIELEDIAGQYNGLREFKDLKDQDYLQIGYAFVQNDPHDFIVWIIINHGRHCEILFDFIPVLNNLCGGNKNGLDCKNDLENTYNYWLAEFIKNNRNIEFDYNQAMAEAYEEFKRNPHDVDDIGD
jgi:hypothetical protein